MWDLFGTDEDCVEGFSRGVRVAATLFGCYTEFNTIGIFATQWLV